MQGACILICFLHFSWWILMILISYLYLSSQDGCTTPTWPAWQTSNQRSVQRQEIYQERPLKAHQNGNNMKNNNNISCGERGEVSYLYLHNHNHVCRGLTISLHHKFTESLEFISHNNQMASNATILFNTMHTMVTVQHSVFEFAWTSFTEKN